MANYLQCLWGIAKEHTDVSVLKQVKHVKSRHYSTDTKNRNRMCFCFCILYSLQKGPRWDKCQFKLQYKQNTEHQLIFAPCWPRLVNWPTTMSIFQSRAHSWVRFLSAFLKKVHFGTEYGLLHCNCTESFGFVFLQVTRNIGTERLFSVKSIILTIAINADMVWALLFTDENCICD